MEKIQRNQINDVQTTLPDTFTILPRSKSITLFSSSIAGINYIIPHRMFDNQII